MYIAKTLIPLSLCSVALCGSVSADISGANAVPTRGMGGAAAGSDDDVICRDEHCYPRLFRPTHDFAQVLDGQEVPAGLHIRLDFESGRRWAKLNDPNESIDADQRAVVLHPDGSTSEHEDGGAGERQHAFAAPDGDKGQQPAKSGHDSSMPKVTVKPSTRKRAPQSHSDRSSFEDAVAVVVTASIRPSETTLTEVQGALSVLEELVHELDFGEDLAAGEGLDALVRVIEGKEAWDEDIRSRAAIVLGSALQNNQGVQHAALASDIVVRLVHVLASSTTAHDRAHTANAKLDQRLIYALSALTRNQSRAMSVFASAHGLSLFSRLYRRQEKTTSHGLSLRRRLVIFVEDFFDPGMHDGEVSVTADMDGVRAWCENLANAVVEGTASTNTDDDISDEVGALTMLGHSGHADKGGCDASILGKLHAWTDAGDGISDVATWKSGIREAFGF